MSTPDAQIASLQAELEDARDEAELNLLQLQQVQEELEHYFLRCQQLEQHGDTSTMPKGLTPSPLPLPVPTLRRLLHLLLESLPPADLLSLAHRCHLHGIHNLAMPLLDAAVARASADDPSLAARAQLQSALTRLTLGRRQGGERLLQAMAAQDLPDPHVRCLVRA